MTSVGYNFNDFFRENQSLKPHPTETSPMIIIIIIIIIIYLHKN